ncbi:MAG: ATP-binding protein [Alphaproteobacteria bacterium]
MKRNPKHEALSTLASGLAHDVNNILSVIDSAAQAALQKGAPAAEMKKIITAAQNGGALTRQLLAFSGQQVALPRPLELKPALVALSVLLQPALGMDIALQIKSPPRLAVQASEEQLALIALNLALNARDAMPAGGCFTVTAAPSRRKSFILLTFADNGLGIRADDRKKIFDPFFSTRARGRAGLGLSVVHGIVTQLGGSIAVKSKPGKGACFDLLLPRAKAVKKKPGETRPAELLDVLALAMRDGGTKYLAASNAQTQLHTPDHSAQKKRLSRLEKTLRRARERRAERLRRGEDTD